MQHVFKENCGVLMMYRRPGQSRITTPRKETHTCKILSGVSEGQYYFRLLLAIKLYLS